MSNNGRGQPQRDEVKRAKTELREKGRGREEEPREVHDLEAVCERLDRIIELLEAERDGGDSGSRPRRSR
jgi:hypothetical protein